MRSETSPGLPQVDYYAPEFRVEVGGEELHPDTKGDVLEVKVVMDIDNITSFDLKVNNWDDRTLSFKYSDTDLFDLGRKIHVQLGYADELASMTRGIVTSLTPQFPESGPPTMHVTGHDALFCLKDNKPDDGGERQYLGMTDWEIAEAVADRNGLDCEVTKEGAAHDAVIQRQDDATFLLERAKRIDFDVFVRTDPKSGKDTLHFIRPTDGRDSRALQEYRFEWGASLPFFSPKISLSGQVGSLTVRGWNPQTKKPIRYTATSDDLPRGDTDGTNGPDAIAACFPGEQSRQERSVDALVTSEDEARRLAISLLRERAYEFVTGTGRSIGLPDLRPGHNVLLAGLGQRFSGRYYVKKVEHTLGSSGFRTQFEVRKFVDGGVRRA